MIFDYSKLKSKIVEKFGNQSKFAMAMDWSEHTLSQKISSKIPWKQTDICLAARLLELSESDIQEYFFTILVQNI